MTTIGDRVMVVVRHQEDGNVSAAARRLGVSQRGLQKVCSGKVRNPGTGLLIRVCEEYDVDPTWLLLGTPRTRPGPTKLELVTRDLLEVLERHGATP